VRVYKSYLLTYLLIAKNDGILSLILRRLLTVNCSRYLKGDAKCRKWDVLGVTMVAR